MFDHEAGRGGWIRTTDVPCIRRLLSPLSYSPAAAILHPSAAPPGARKELRSSAGRGKSSGCGDLRPAIGLARGVDRRAHGGRTAARSAMRRPWTSARTPLRQRPTGPGGKGHAPRTRRHRGVPRDRVPRARRAPRASARRGGVDRQDRSAARWALPGTAGERMPERRRASETRRGTARRRTRRTSMTGRGGGPVNPPRDDSPASVTRNGTKGPSRRRCGTRVVVPVGTHQRDGDRAVPRVQRRAARRRAMHRGLEPFEPSVPAG